jgi:hypothetical protein
MFEIYPDLREKYRLWRRETYRMFIIIIFLHGLGRLTCSGIERVAIVSWGVHDLFFLEVCS